jgi:hypothetical protein
LRSSRRQEALIKGSDGANESILNRLRNGEKNEIQRPNAFFTIQITTIKTIRPKQNFPNRAGFFNNQIRKITTITSNVMFAISRGIYSSGLFVAATAANPPKSIRDIDAEKQKSSQPMSI